MHVIVGLGNPGEKYEKTRHNAGWIVLDEIFSGVEWEYSKYANALFSHQDVGGEHAELLKPHTFMNKSGGAVKYAVDKYELVPEDVIVTYDDIDLPIGTFKISHGRSSGGHNGVQSLITSLGTPEFTRIRIGISPVSFFGNMKKPQGRDAVSRFVLQPFASGELKKVKNLAPDIKSALETLVKEGREAAMNKFN